MPVVADEDNGNGKTTSKVQRSVHTPRVALKRWVQQVIGLISVGDLLATMLSELKASAFAVLELVTILSVQNSTKFMQAMVSGKYPA